MIAQGPQEQVRENCQVGSFNKQIQNILSLAKVNAFGVACDLKTEEISKITQIFYAKGRTKEVGDVLDFLIIVSSYDNIINIYEERRGFIDIMLQKKRMIRRTTYVIM